MKFKFLILTIFVAGVTSCKLAKFGFIGKQGAGGDSSVEGGPNPSGGTPLPSNGSTSGMPNAAVEVEQLGVVLQNVVVNVPVVIRPTIDTIDADNGRIENCVNNGIVKTTYTLNGETKSFSRKAGECTTLAYENYTFKQTGLVQIGLEVESDEGETALASGVIQVVSSDNPPESPLPSLIISAVPMVSLTGTPVKFTAICYTPGMHQVTWNFADGSAETVGDEVSHSFSTSGQFYVKATCVGGETSLNGGVTVVIQNGSSTSPGSSNPPGGGTTGTNGSPTATPGSTKNPGQNNPNQK